MSTFAFTVCFAVWTVFAIIGIEIKQELGLNETQFGLLVGTPILTGSLVRLFLGVWTDQYGGRIVFPLTMLASAASALLLSYADTYLLLLLASLGLGLAGGGFAVGVAYVSKWYPQEPARGGSRLLRHGQCRGGGDQVRGSLGHGGHGLAGGGADLGDCTRGYRSHLFPVGKG
ncbi:MAG: MFS transporter [Sphingomonadales bacterium]|nr:MFS transporter [Sphingomonadales bacterium]